MTIKSTKMCIRDRYRALVQYAVENGYEPCGIAFEEDLMNQMIDQNRDNYLVQCYVQVRKV